MTKEQNKNEHSNFTYQMILTLPSLTRHEENVISEKCVLPFIEKFFHGKEFLLEAFITESKDLYYIIHLNAPEKQNVYKAFWNTLINQDALNYVNIYSQEMNEFYKNGFRCLPDFLDSEESQVKFYLQGKQSNFSTPNTVIVQSTKMVNIYKKMYQKAQA